MQVFIKTSFNKIQVNPTISKSLNKTNRNIFHRKKILTNFVKIKKKTMTTQSHRNGRAQSHPRVS